MNAVHYSVTIREGKAIIEDKASDVSPLSQMNLLKGVATIRFEKGTVVDKDILLKNLRTRALSEVTVWTRIWQVVVRAFFFCCFKTTAQKVYALYPELSEKGFTIESAAKEKVEQKKAEQEAKHKEDEAQRNAEEARVKAEQDAKEKARQQAELEAAEKRKEANKLAFDGRPREGLRDEPILASRRVHELCLQGKEADAIKYAESLADQKSRDAAFAKMARQTKNAKFAERIIDVTVHSEVENEVINKNKLDEAFKNMKDLAVRLKADREAKLKEVQQKEDEARRKAEQEAQRNAEEARLKAEQEAKQKAEEEARAQAELEAKRRADEEVRLKAIEDAKPKCFDDKVMAIAKVKEWCAKKEFGAAQDYINSLQWPESHKEAYHVFLNEKIKDFTDNRKFDEALRYIESFRSQSVLDACYFWFIQRSNHSYKVIRETVEKIQDPKLKEIAKTNLLNEEKLMKEAAANNWIKAVGVIDRVRYEDVREQLIQSLAPIANINLADALKLKLNNARVKAYFVESVIPHMNNLAQVTAMVNSIEDAGKRIELFNKHIQPVKTAIAEINELIMQKKLPEAEQRIEALKFEDVKNELREKVKVKQAAERYGEGTVEDGACSIM